MMLLTKKNHKTRKINVQRTNSLWEVRVSLSLFFSFGTTTLQHGAWQRSFCVVAFVERHCFNFNAKWLFKWLDRLASILKSV